MRKIWPLIAVGLSALVLLMCVALMYLRPERVEDSAVSPVKLSFWTVNSRYAAYMQACCEAYNRQAEQPIELDVKVYSSSFIVDQISKSLANEAAAPDIVDIQFNDFNRFLSRAYMKLLLYPLGSLAADDEPMLGFALTPFTINDALLAIPYNTGELAVFYNLELAEAYGIDPLSATDWPSYLALGEALPAGGPALFPLDIVNNDLLYALMLNESQEIPNMEKADILASPAALAIEEMLTGALSSGLARVPDEYDILGSAFYRAFERGEYLSVIAPLEYANELVRNLQDMRGKVLMCGLPLSQPVSVAQYGTAIAVTCRDIDAARKLLSFAKFTAEASRGIAKGMSVRGISARVRETGDLSHGGYFMLGPFADAPQSARHFTGTSGMPDAAREIALSLLNSLDEK